MTILSHTQRAVRMYGGPASSAAPAVRSNLTRAAAGARLYVPSAQEGGSHETAVDSWKTRRRSKFINDKELRDQVDLEAAQVKAYAVKHGWSPQETQTA